MNATARESLRQLHLCAATPISGRFGPWTASSTTHGGNHAIRQVRSMLRNVLITVGALATGAAAPAFARAPASSRAEPPAPRATAAACTYLGLRLGPVIELSAGDKLTIDPAHELLRIASDGDVSFYDLDKGGLAEVKEPTRFRPGPHMSPASLPPAAALADSAGEAAEDLARKPGRVLANGRRVSISRLYVNNYLIKVGAADRLAYRRFGEGLLAGAYCGTPLADLTPETRAKLKPLVTYFLFDALSSDKLDDFASWVKYSPVFKAFLDIKETEEFLEIYGYRSAKQGVRVPGLARMDPNKLWTFAWNAAAKLFHDEDFTDFSDLSAYQRDGRVTFIALGSQPIPGGHANKYGFYTKLETSISVTASAAPRSYHWEWPQGDRVYAADIDLSEPIIHPRSSLSRFPGRDHRGLIVFDVTMTRADVEDLLEAYQSYFRTQGFTFAARTPVADAPKYVEAEIGAGDLDYLLRDGHSDGDDENVMALYPTGFVIEGRRPGKGSDDTIRIVFNLQKNPPTRRIPYDDFYRLVEARYAAMHEPLVFFDGSCWGVEKAWFPLAVEPSSRLIEIAANSAVNFFENVDRNAMRRVLDAILHGDSFARVRAGLKELRGYRSSREDRFVFPNDRLYPQAGPILEIKKRLSVTLPGKPPRPYTPDGYL